MSAPRLSLVLASLAALAACADGNPAAPALHSGAPLHAAIPGRALDGEYVVVVRAGADARSVAAVLGIVPRRVYTAALNGFAGPLNAGQLNALRHSPDVEYVEEDSRVDALATQTGAPWALDRIDQRALPLSGTYGYTSTGANVRAYVIDTGLQANHPQFGTRAQNVFDALGGTGADCNGHGTHVAGIVGGSTYGVAKGALLRGVRALDCNGSATTSAIISAIDWVRINHQKPAVANLSIGGGYSAAMNTAVTTLSDAGVFVAVASGSENQNACNVSPASAPAVFTAAGTNIDDSRRSSSNWGSCVDGYAPGTNIVSAWLNGGTATLSGSSLAAPHVAGVAALRKSALGDAASSTVDAWIKTNATANVVKGNVTGTPNRLLYKASL